MEESKIRYGEYKKKVRTLRDQIVYNTRQKVNDESLSMTWMVRWAAELISRYSVGDDGMTAFERIRKEKCIVPLAMIGEIVLYLPLKIARGSKGEPAKHIGVWLGTIERTEEVLIGTSRGVVKCRTISRSLDADKWDVQTINTMKGTPWEPVPGRQSQHIPVAIGDDGAVMDEETKTLQPADKGQDGEAADEKQYRFHPDQLHVSRKAIARYGQTEGCPACRMI